MLWLKLVSVNTSYWHILFGRLIFVPSCPLYWLIFTSEPIGTDLNFWRKVEIFTIYGMENFLLKYGSWSGRQYITRALTFAYHNLFSFPESPRQNTPWNTFAFLGNLKISKFPADVEERGNNVKLKALSEQIEIVLWTNQTPFNESEQSNKAFIKLFRITQKIQEILKVYLTV